MSDDSDDTKAWQRWWTKRTELGISRATSRSPLSPRYWPATREDSFLDPFSDELIQAITERYGRPPLQSPQGLTGVKYFINTSYYPMLVGEPVWQPWDDVQLRDAFPPLTRTELRRMLSLPLPATVRDAFLDRTPSNLPERDWQRLNDLLLALYPDPA